MVVGNADPKIAAATLPTPLTVNEYLARRDAVWMGQVYHALGLTVACLVPNGAFAYDPAFIPNPAGEDPEREPTLLDKERDTTGSFMVQQEFLRPIPRREAYRADITYGTNHEFGFDYLRDNLAQSIEQQAQGELFFAIIDEGRLYFVTDDVTRPAYEERGMKPFQYAPGKFIHTYYEVPVDVLEDDRELCEWARAAVAAQGRRKTKKPKSKRSRPS